MGYDNEQGKGDHRHYGARELPYLFDSIEQLMADFGSDIGLLDKDETGLHADYDAVRVETQITM